MIELTLMLVPNRRIKYFDLRIPSWCSSVVMRCLNFDSTSFCHVWSLRSASNSAACFIAWTWVSQSDSFLLYLSSSNSNSASVLFCLINGTKFSFEVLEKFSIISRAKKERNDVAEIGNQEKQSMEKVRGSKETKVAYVTRITQAQLIFD